MITVCYTVDESYVMQMCVSMVSILENNRENELEFYILGDTYSDDVTERLRLVSEKYKCDIHIVDISSKMELLAKTVLGREKGIVKSGKISYMFARLFIGSSIPENIDKVIYLDCDTVYINNIRELINIKIESDNLFAAVRDLWPVSYNRVLGFEINDLYFQSGIMLINLKKWRAEKCEKKILEHINMLDKPYFMHDQDILNVCFKGKIQTLPLKFGMVYQTRNYTAGQILEGCGKDEQHYYTEAEVNEAKKHIHVIHYTGGYYGRPWVFPMGDHDSRLWYSYYKLTPWKKDSLRDYAKKEYVKYLLKMLLAPFVKDLWRKRTAKRFQKIVAEMLGGL